MRLHAIKKAKAANDDRCILFNLVLINDDTSSVEWTHAENTFRVERRLECMKLLRRRQSRFKEKFSGRNLLDHLDVLFDKSLTVKLNLKAKTVLSGAAQPQLLNERHQRNF